MPSSPSSSSTPPPALAPLARVLLLADLGLAATGTLISSMAVNSRARDLLVPLVLLPLLVPLMIAATGAAEPLLAAGGPGYDALRHLAGGARPLRCGLPPGRIRGLRLPAGGLTGAARSHRAMTHVRQRPESPLDRDRRGARRRLRAGLLLRAARRRQGFIQKIFYLHVPLAIVRAGRLRGRRRLRDPPPAQRRPPLTTPAPTSRSTSR